MTKIKKKKKQEKQKKKRKKERKKKPASQLATLAMDELFENQVAMTNMPKHRNSKDCFKCQSLKGREMLHIVLK